MIEADVIKILRSPAHPVDPPCISSRLHHIPPVKRIAPPLAVFAEKIWRNAGNNLRIEFAIQPKKIGVGPHIGTVKIQKDRDVARNPNRPPPAIGAKRPPLLIEKKLHHPAKIQIFSHFLMHFFNRQRVAMSQFVWPAVPRFQLETCTQAVEEDKVIKPPSVFPAKIFKTAPGLRRGGSRKVSCRLK